MASSSHFYKKQERLLNPVKTVNNTQPPQALQEQRHPKPSVETPRVVALVPARHQACRINHPHLYRSVVAMMVHLLVFDDKFFSSTMAYPQKSKMAISCPQGRCVVCVMVLFLILQKDK